MKNNVLLSAMLEKKKREEKSISLRNFRKFQFFPNPKVAGESFVLNDITLLVGKNNAGKSTLAKALILIVENLTKPSNLPFSDNAYFSFRSEKYPLHIDTFKRALNNQTQERIIQLNASINEFCFEIDIVEADDHVLYNYIQEEEDATAPVRRLFIKDSKRGLSLTILPYDQRFILTIENRGELFDDAVFALDSAEERIKSLSEYIQQLNTTIESNVDLMTGEALSLEQIVDFNDKLNKAEAQLKKVKSERNRTAHAGDGKYEIMSSWLTYQDSLDTKLPILQDVEAIIDYKAPDTKSNSSAFSRFFKAKDMESFDAIYSAISLHKSELREMADELDRTLRSISVEYLQAHLASQEIMLNPNEPGNIMARIIDQYETYTRKHDQNGSVRNFILKWMNRDNPDTGEKGFDIGKDFKIYHYPGHNYVMTIQDFNGKEVNVSDMGMGTNQLLILLFQVANNAVYGKTPLMIIEEPEQNLHPQMQSRLADFMAKVNEKYGILFLVETHSEYLIKRTQVMVGDAEYIDEADMKAGNPFVVYYFDEERGVYDMKYQRSGAFAEKFGDGFVDVAPMAHMKTMMRQRKEQQNA